MCKEVIQMVHEAGAKTDAWRSFFAGGFHGPFIAGGASLETVSREWWSAKNLLFSFPKETAEEQVVELINRSRAHSSEPFQFRRTNLKDPRAGLELPLSDFVECNRDYPVPVIEFSIHKHWQVRLENFSLTNRQENYKRLHCLSFSHPDLKYQSTQEVVSMELPGMRAAERLETLFKAAEQQGPHWQFSILEREVVKRLNGDPHARVLAAA